MTNAGLWIAVQKLPGMGCLQYSIDPYNWKAARKPALAAKEGTTHGCCVLEYACVLKLQGPPSQCYAFMLSLCQLNCCCCFCPHRSKLACCGEPSKDAHLESHNPAAAASAMAAPAAAVVAAPAAAVAAAGQVAVASAAAAARVSSYRRGKGLFPRAGRSECVWVTHALDAPIHVSRDIKQIGIATATW